MRTPSSLPWQFSVSDADMLTINFAILLALLATRPAPAADPVLRLTADELDARPTLCLVPEMAFVPEADTWEACPPGAVAERDGEAFRAAWAEQAPWAAGHVTLEVVRALSRWARPQMEKYAAVPPLDKLAFMPVTMHKARGMVVYEAAADELPTHSPLVKRWLKVYVLYSTEAKAVLRVTVTIRGQVTE
jgi:hypothetical protein